MKNGSWRRRRDWLWQGLALGAALLLLGFLARNFVVNARQLGLTLNFDFFWSGDRPASFNIGDSPIPFQAGDPLAKALLVGLLNTLRVTGVGIILATVLGILVALARLAPHWLLAQLARLYVTVLRNTPLLLQLFFWYFNVFLQLPPGDNPQRLGAWLALSNQGLQLGPVLIAPEYAALATGLTVYTSAFIAEVIRGGLQAVDRGQTEAAKALGLKEFTLLRRVVLPQALPIILPSLTSEYLNLAKNSSLAIAIGFSDLYAVASTLANQSGRAVEMLLVVMGAYLLINGVIAALMNQVLERVKFEH
jgi:general L-amino acid transport system permease protein